MDCTDLELLRAYVEDRDSKSFDALVGRHSRWIVSAAHRRLSDEHLAEDAAQAVFLLLATKAAEVADTDRKSIAAWLFHAMHLTCSRLRRSRDRQERRESAEPNPASGELPSDELRVLLEDSIAQLPRHDRQSIVGRFYQGKDYETIGRGLGCSGEAARKRIIRSLATVRAWMLRDGVDVIPDQLLLGVDASGHSSAFKSRDNERIGKIAEGASIMMRQAETTDFTIWSAEFFVKDVEANLDFFEKLGFRRHFIETPDAMGRMPRASLRGGNTARIWLRRAGDDGGTRPTPGVTLFFWIEGGADALIAQRDAIAAQGVKPSAFFDDVSLRNFTVTSPDGYSIGFFTTYK